MPVKEIANAEYKLQKATDPDNLLIDGQAIPELKSKCLEKIRAAAVSGNLAQNRKLDFILYYWQEWTDNNEAGEWVSKLVRSTSGIICFLRAYVSYSTSQELGSYSVKRYSRINLKSLEPFITIEELEEQINSIDRDSLKPEELTVLKVFEKAVERRREGKSEDVWDVRDDDYEII